MKNRTLVQTEVSPHRPKQTSLSSTSFLGLGGAPLGSQHTSDVPLPPVAKSRPVVCKGLLPFAAAVAVTFAGMHPLVAQCVSGVGATGALAGSQSWAGTVAQDYSAASVPGGSIVGLATDGSGVTALFPNQSANMANGGLLALVVKSANTYEGVSQSTNASSSGGLVVRGIATPTGVFSAGNYFWVAGAGGEIGELTAGEGYNSQKGPSQVTGAAYDGAYVWFATKEGSLLQVQVDEGAGAFTMIKTYRVSSSPLVDLKFDGNTLWTADAKQLYGFNPSTQAVTATVPVESGSQPKNITGLTFDGVYLWIANATDSGLIKYDPVEGKTVLTTAATGGGRSALLFDGRNIISLPAAGHLTVFKTRACDGAANGSYNLPASPAGGVFDGTKTWIYYPNSAMISIR